MLAALAVGCEVTRGNIVAKIRVDEETCILIVNTSDDREALQVPAKYCDQYEVGDYFQPKASQPD